MGLLRYSNSWGHFLMSIVCIAGGIILMLLGDTSSKAIGTTLVLSVNTFWFLSSMKTKELEKNIADSHATNQPVISANNNPLL